jgi:hypothetical protein
VGSIYSALFTVVKNVVSLCTFRGEKEGFNQRVGGFGLANKKRAPTTGSRLYTDSHCFAP